LYRAFVYNNETNNKFFMFEISDPIFSVDNQTFFSIIENLKSNENNYKINKNYSRMNNQTNPIIPRILDLYTTKFEEVYLNRLKVYYLIFFSINSLCTCIWCIILYKRKNYVHTMQKLLTILSIFRILLTFIVIIYLAVTAESKNY
jgi:hypothetical protein